MSIGESYDSIGGSPYTRRNWGGGSSCDHGDGIVNYNDLVDLLNGGIYFQLHGINSTTSAVVRKPQRGGASSARLKELLGSNSIENKVGTITGLQHVYNNGHSIATNTRRTEKLIVTGTNGIYEIGLCNISSTKQDNCFRQAYNIRSECSLWLPTNLWEVEFSTNNTKFFTRGYIHRVGLSQYGAYGRAKNGQTYTQIIQHYYQGTAISNYDSNKNIRIGLTKIPSSFVIEANGSGSITAGGDKVFDINNGDRITIIEM